MEFLMLAQFETETAAYDAWEQLSDMYDESQQLEVVVPGETNEVQKAFGRNHGFEWPEDDGFYSKKSRATVQMYSVGKVMIVYHFAAFRSGEAGIRKYWEKVGAERWVGGAFRARISAKTAKAEQELENHLAELLERINDAEDEDDSPRVSVTDNPTDPRYRYSYTILELQLNGKTTHVAFEAEFAASELGTWLIDLALLEEADDIDLELLDEIS